ncbi:MAG: HD domain-containing protein [Verrucomicrobiota bacterium]|nr:HD domain-containing protein [Verrucomicrobiota bacterium]
MAKEFLSSNKKIYDAVHGFIPLDELEKELVDSFPFQRLHYIHQLGIAYLVYPGATHSRFEHSLGVMFLATLMFDKICKSVRPDVFHFVPRKGSAEYHYWRRVLRMAALCHDLGHLPFSHVAEKDLLGVGGHEGWTLKIIESSYLQPIWEKLLTHSSYGQALTEKNVVEDIKKVAIGEEKWHALTGQSFTAWEKVVSELITGDFFGADRIDYLLRDARSTGVVYGLFDYHQLIETLRILPNAEEGDSLQLGIDENGLESCEALMLARHFMHRRIYQYSSVKAYNFHLRRYMKAHFDKKALESVDLFLSVSDIDLIAALMKAARDPQLPGHRDARCIIFREHRFRALTIPPAITEKDLAEFRKREKIPPSEIGWEFHTACPSLDRLSFPVSRRHVVIQKAHECSELLLKLPAKRSNWLYISPTYDVTFLHFLEEWAHR